MLSTLKSLVPLSRGTLRSDTTACLVQAVLKGELKQGHKLVVRKLAEQLQVSATPVREAIVELEAIGIVEVPPNQNAIIRRFGAKELSEIYHLRGLLEGEAARLSCDHLPQNQLVAIRDEIKELLDGTGPSGKLEWTAKAIEENRQFHQFIADFCGSGRLLHEIARYTRLMSAINEVVGNERGGLVKALQDHQGIVEALLVPDPDLAARRMAEHIRFSAERDIEIVYGGSPRKLAPAAKRNPSKKARTTSPRSARSPASPTAELLISDDVCS